MGLDRRGVGNIGHLRFYDLIKESTRQKRNRAVIDNTSLKSPSVLFPQHCFLALHYFNIVKSEINYPGFFVHLYRIILVYYENSGCGYLAND